MIPTISAIKQIMSVSIINWVTSCLLCPPNVFLNPISFNLLLNMSIEVFEKLKDAINRIKRAIIGGAIRAAGCNEGKSPADQVVLEFDPTSLKAVSYTHLTLPT